MKVILKTDGSAKLELSRAEVWDLRGILLTHQSDLMAKSVTGETVSQVGYAWSKQLVSAELPKAQERTFATKAERAAGKGYPCPNCKRNDLRVEVKVGRSFHDKDVKGNSEICDLR